MEIDISERFKKFETGKLFGFLKYQHVCFFTGNINYLTYMDDNLHEYSIPCTVLEFNNLFVSLGVHEFSHLRENSDVRFYKSDNRVLFNNLLILMMSFHWRSFGETRVALSSNGKNLDKVVRIIFVSDDELLFRYTDYSMHKEKFTSFLKKEILMQDDSGDRDVHYTNLSKLLNAKLPAFNERTFYNQVELGKIDYTSYLAFQSFITIINEEYAAKREQLNLILVFRNSGVGYEGAYRDGSFILSHSEIGMADIYIDSTKAGEMYAPGYMSI